MDFKRILLVFIISLLVTYAFIYPTINNITTHIPAFSSTDEPYGVIWSFWWLKHALLNKIPANFIDSIAYPFGIKTVYIPFFPLWGLMAKYLAVIVNEIFAYNLILLSTFIFSVITTYLLAFYLTKNFWASIFSSLVYAFCPFHFVRLWQHFGTAQIQWMPLYLLLLFKLWEKKNMMLALLLGLTLAFNCYFDVHYAYFMLIMSFLFCAVVLFYNTGFSEKARFFGYFSISVLFSGIFILPALLPFLNKLTTISPQFISAYSLIRPFGDLFTQSARPLSYILPFSEQPIFGNITNMFIGTSLWGESLTEHNIFLGFVPVFLSTVALIKRKGIITQLNRGSQYGGFYFNYFICFIIAAWLFSQPPWWQIFGLKIYMPSFFMYKVFPMFRAYVRFALMVMLGVSIFSGFGLMYFISKFKQKAYFSILMCSIVLFEFWSIPGEHIIDLSDYPRVYDWLKGQEEDLVIAEYPLDIEGSNELYKFYQTKHHKKIINGTTPGSSANRVAQAITKLSSPYTAGVLKWMGVKYALVHKEDYSMTGLTVDSEELNRIPRNPGLRLIMSFAPQECPQEGIMCIRKTGPIDVYMLETAAIDPRVNK